MRYCLVKSLNAKQNVKNEGKKTQTQERSQPNDKEARTILAGSDYARNNGRRDLCETRENYVQSRDSGGSTLKSIESREGRGRKVVQPRLA